MKEDKIKYLSLGVGAAVIVALLAWDSLTPSSYGELTINPSEVDWGLMSRGNIDVNSLIHTILSAVIGFMLTIVVVEQLLRASRERELQYKRDLQLKNISKIIQVPLFRYEKAALSVTYGIGNIPADGKIKVPVEAKDLIHIFEYQAYADEPLFQTSIELYASAVDDLKACITNILLNVDLSDNDELSELLSKYIRKVSRINPCKQILEMRKIVTGKGSVKKKMVEVIRSDLPTINLDTVSGSNLFEPFARLKEMIEYHEDFLKKLYELAPNFRYNESTK